jgi:hypothetical protein
MIDDDARALDDGEPITHERLKEAAQALQRPLDSLYVLSSGNDPFMLGLPSRQRAVDWFMRLWTDLGLDGSQVHIRRIHYVLVSQASTIALAAGGDYENTIRCQNILINAARDARFLGLIPAGTIIDRKNPEPAIYLADESDAPAKVDVDAGTLIVPTVEDEPTLYLPSLTLTRPVIPQRYHIEIWCEKSTMNDVLTPLGERYGINVITGTGELSLTACEALIERARASGRPVRIIYVSDFDPAGENMPVSVARKIEFAIRNAANDWLDVQVRAVALTYDQTVAYRLPRTPIKESDRRGNKFEQRYGEGATELDALEALQPGELRRILVGEVERYFDTRLAGRINAVARKVEQKMSRVTANVRERHRDEIAALEAGREEIATEIEAMRERIAEMENALEAQTQPVVDAMSDELEAEMPGLDDFEWPEPQEGYEDDDPLYDSSRGYLDQLERYRRHQGKAAPRGLRERTVSYDRVCLWCDTPFTATAANAKFCSDEHRYAYKRRRNRGPAKPSRKSKGPLPGAKGRKRRRSR